MARSIGSSKLTSTWRCSSSSSLLLSVVEHDCKICFFYKHMNNDMTHFSFLFKFPFFNYPFLSNAAQPDYGIINLIIFPLFGFYSGEKITDKNF